MNKKEIAEIKKNFSTESGFFTMGKVLSALIDPEKNIVYQHTALSHLMPSEELELIMEALKKTLSGTLGKNLREYPFPKEQYEEDGTQRYMHSVLTSRFEDDEQNTEFLRRIADNIEYISSFAVFAAHCTYSVMKKNKNDDDMDEADTDYNFIITAICPVELRMDGLIVTEDTEDAEGESEGEEKGEKKQRICKATEFDRVIQPPTDGFLFPVFSERAPDVNAVLYYTKKPKDPNISVVEDFLGCEFSFTANTEKEMFQTILSKALGEDLDYSLITGVNEKLTEFVNSSTNDTEPAQVDSAKLSSVLWECGVTQDKLEHIPQVFDNATEGKSLTAANLIDRKTTVETEGITVNIGKDCVDKVQTSEIGGRRCLVIALDESVSVNGLPANVKPISEKS